VGGLLTKASAGPGVVPKCGPVTYLKPADWLTLTAFFGFTQ